MAANPEIERYIREAARTRGIDENVAVAVSKAEALNVFDPSKPDLGGDDRSSFGPFQLHYAGLSQKMPNAGLGDEFTAKTGLHASDPSTWRQQIDFSLDHAARAGWGAWMGAANTGIGKWQGIKPGAGGGVSTAVANATVQPAPYDWANSTANAQPQLDYGISDDDYTSPLAETFADRVGPRSMLREEPDTKAKTEDELLPSFDFGGPVSGPPAAAPPATDDRALAAAPTPLPLTQLASLFKLPQIGGAGDEDGQAYDPRARRRSKLPTLGYG